MDAAPGAVQGGAMINMVVCHRDKTLCVDCDSDDCVLAGDIESDCPAWVCQRPEKRCEDCELLKEYVDKWRREHGTD